MTRGVEEFTEPIRALLTLGGDDLRLMPLVPSAPANGPELAELRKLETDRLFPPGEIRSRDFARCVHAGLLLYFSALDESHTISQGIHTTSGSYWHGIMHRQEGDWSNAKYWFRRVGRHPVLDQLAAESARGWDAFDFIDRCKAAARGSGGATGLRERQMREWLLLMRYCHRRALAG